MNNCVVIPLLKSLNLLKVEDIFKIQQLRFVQRHYNINLPTYQQKTPVILNVDVHSYNTKIHVNIERVNTKFAQKTVKYRSPSKFYHIYHSPSFPKWNCCVCQEFVLFVVTFVFDLKDFHMKTA